MITTIEASPIARFLYSVHRTWVSVWPITAGRYSFRRVIRLAARFGVFPPVWAKLEHGWMLLDPREHIERGIPFDWEWEREVEDLTRSHLRPGCCFVDIGANVGYFSLLAASIVGPSGCVLAFEPNPAIRSKLLSNIAKTGYTNVRICGAARMRPEPLLYI